MQGETRIDSRNHMDISNSFLLITSIFQQNTVLQKISIFYAQFFIGFPMVLFSFEQKLTG